MLEVIPTPVLTQRPKIGNVLQFRPMISISYMPATWEPLSYEQELYFRTVTRDVFAPLI
jgi:hypothetical protein